MSKSDNDFKVHHKILRASILKSYLHSTISGEVHIIAWKQLFIENHLLEQNDYKELGSKNDRKMMCLK